MFTTRRFIVAVCLRMMSAALPLPMALTLHQTTVSYLLPWDTFVQSSRKIKSATPFLFLFLPFIIVTFPTLPYLGNVRGQSLLVRGERKLDTYTVLLLGANAPLRSSGGAAGRSQERELSAQLGLNPDYSLHLQVALALASWVLGGARHCRG